MVFPNEPFILSNMLLIGHPFKDEKGDYMDFPPQSLLLAHLERAESLCF